MEEDFEFKFLTILAKVKKELGDIDLLRSFSKSVVWYFYKEYFDKGYNKENITEDICNIVNELIWQSKFKPLNNILTDDELSIITSVIVSESENLKAI